MKQWIYAHQPPPLISAVRKLQSSLLISDFDFLLHKRLKLFKTKFWQWFPVNKKSWCLSYLQCTKVNFILIDDSRYRRIAHVFAYLVNVQIQRLQITPDQIDLRSEEHTSELQ